MAEKRKRCSLSISEKQQIIKYVNENPVMKRIDIVKKFEIPISTLATILKSKERFSEETGLPLPSLKTLNKFVRKISCLAYGFQPSTFNCLKERCQSIKDSERRGVLLVDEINLYENVTFDSLSMKYNGFVDLAKHTPHEEKNMPADHTLVFMVVTFRGRWAQALGCFLSRNACTSVLLRKLMSMKILLYQ
ncbi:hypothetical protein KQX54_015256 [Cotesia glomerata]|uniref:HTH psq-type domain-containing protein n=1 Tax=Cotesia glomerata TaxID=32391 RepID=A0AAV7J8G4_COTGL|nr:hypothetical protein KQX54_015256 [Cotesia glomerata]